MFNSATYNSIGYNAIRKAAANILRHYVTQPLLLGSMIETALVLGQPPVAASPLDMQSTSDILSL